MMMWYLSFADDDGFLGALIMRGPSIEVVLTMSHVLKLNPGGEVLYHPIPDDMPPPEEFCNRLLSKQDLVTLDSVMGGFSN